MRKLKFSLDTLNQELRERNIFNVAEVNYAGKSSNGHVYCDRYDDQMSNPIDQE